MNTEIPIKIKKYANRRLYNMATSSYVTLDDLATLIKEGQDFVVYDAKSNEELTRQVMIQIILEKEAGGRPLMPTSFLKNMIRYYDNKLSSNLSSYLDMMMTAFTHQKPDLSKTFSDAFPMMDLKKNTEIFEKMMGVKSKPISSELDEIRAEMAKLQEKMDKLSRN